MNICLITPADKHSTSGNRTSALRWARLLRQLRHRVRIEVDYAGGAADLMVALHAWRSADAVWQYRQRYPNGPLIVVLTGTDVNTYLHTAPQVTLSVMRNANALVCLHALVADILPVDCQRKLHFIRQSAQALASPRKPLSAYFDICVIGHLRAEKDPLRTALAARLLAPSSKIRINHFGKAHDEQWQRCAVREMAQNPRYIWHGEVPRWRLRREFSRSRLMVISSRQEGGANVVSEALAARVPIIASAISGNIGLLGEDYPGYYPLADEKALAVLLNRAEAEPDFIATLETYCHKLAPFFTQQKEAAAWQTLIDTIA